MESNNTGSLAISGWFDAASPAITLWVNRVHRIAESYTRNPFDFDGIPKALGVEARLHLTR
ncbi:MAG: hypothetical protein ONB13_02835 [candidate division KSB1 bacterium]|nr:hypothetical protein [candidate division KSB1 bacterium]MDZ7336756.1 hypothetical protein [candidate division KSB1 bacterium]MDZ7375535.1 hypothetical protein [candidate division KSB1 bacterium]MDZ7400115.1 hypothetical protein [candidate division KSB1 bacterium]